MEPQRPVGPVTVTLPSWHAGFRFAAVDIANAQRFAREWADYQRRVAERAIRELSLPAHLLLSKEERAARGMGE